MERHVRLADLRLGQCPLLFLLQIRGLTRTKPQHVLKRLLAEKLVRRPIGGERVERRDASTRMRLVDVLSDDVWTVLAPLLGISDTGAVARTCRAWRRAISLPAIDWLVAQAYASDALGDAAFWDRAILRPGHSRKSLPTFRLEIQRIEEFKRAGGRGRLAACELYLLWEVLDRTAAPGTLSRS